MTTLLVGTLVISGAHTALWLNRSLKERHMLGMEAEETATIYVRRFQPLQRNLHLTVVTSFLGLALTGMVLKFSYAPWAKFLAKLLGGFEAAGLIHRFCAVATFGTSATTSTTSSAAAGQAARPGSSSSSAPTA